MPHDCKGNELKKGDQVILRATVEEVHPQEDACNANFQINDVNGCGEYAPLVTCNTQHAEKVET